MTLINKAYSVLEVKEVNTDGDERIIRGIATTPTPDRVGDIVEPLGVKFQNPLPLLWQHEADKPVGLVTFDKPTKKGITFEARLPKITEEGKLKDRIDEAWQSVKAGLVRAVSIGFRGLEYSFMDNGGIKFAETEVMELSLVTIPANAQANISTIKRFDLNPYEPTKDELKVDTTTSDPGVSGKPNNKNLINKAHSAVKLEKNNMKTFAEQITAFEDTRKVKSARMAELLNASAEAGETLDAEQEEEYDTLVGEVKKIEAHINRLKAAQGTDVSTATPIANIDTQKAASAARAGVEVKRAPEKLDKGIEFARFALAVTRAKGNGAVAYEIAKNKLGEDNAVSRVLKAAVGAGSTTDPDFAGPLVEEYNRFAGDFVEFLRPQTIIGKFGANGVPSLRRVPFNISIPTQTTGGEGYWVGEGQAKPLTGFGFDRINLGWAKVANIAVITEELARWSSPSAEALVRDQLAAALIQRLDIDFLDPGKAAVAGVSPASLTNGVTPITSSGTDIDAVRADIKGLMATYLAANVTPSSGVWIMPAMTALSLSLMTNALGQYEFSTVNMAGGTLFGMPIIVSDYVPAGTVILVNASDVLLADDGQVAVDSSREVSLQMDSAPGHNSTTPTSAQLVSMWQTNSIAIRAERYINWAKRRPNAVAVITGVNWGGAPTT